jgi:hypothetical protein
MPYFSNGMILQKPRQSIKKNNIICLIRSGSSTHLVHSSLKIELVKMKLFLILDVYFCEQNWIELLLLDFSNNITYLASTSIILLMTPKGLCSTKMVTLSL